MGKGLNISGFVLPGLLIVASIGLLVFVHSDYTKKIRETRDQLNVLEGKVKKDIPERHIRAMQRATDSLVVVLQRERRRIYPIEDLIQIGTRLQAIAKRYNLTMTALTPKYSSLINLDTDTSGIAELPVTVTLKGKFSGFTKLMDDLANLEFAVKVQYLSMVRQDEQTATVVIELKGEVFLRNAGKNEEPIPNVTARKT